jgi:aminopeptidase
MLDSDTLDRYADVLLWGLTTARKGRFRKGDVIFLQYDPAATCLAEVLYAKILDRGMYPLQRMGLTTFMERSFYEKATDRHLAWLPPGDRELYEKVNGRIYLRAPESLTHLKDIDPMG